MHRMMMTLFATLLACASPVLSQGKPHDDESDPKSVRKRIDTLLEDWHQEGSGCVVGVVQRGEAIVTRAIGFASVEHRAPLKTSTPIYVGSISKQFLAPLVLLLHSKKSLDLDADVRLLIPELLDYGHKITGRHLLSHTSGLRDYLEILHHGGMERWDYIAPDVLPTIFRQSGLNFKPGLESSYSNTNYVLLRRMIERAFGKDIDKTARQLLFQPLGMTRTRFLITGREVVAGCARAYRKAKGGEFELYEPRPGTTGLLATMDDLMRWSANLRTPKVGG